MTISLALPFECGNYCCVPLDLIRHAFFSTVINLYFFIELDLVAQEISEM